MNCTTVRVIGSRPTESFAMNAICKPTNSAESSVMASPKPNESDSKPSANETNPTPTTQSAMAAMLYIVGLMSEMAQARNGTKAQYAPVRNALFAAVVSVSPAVLNTNLRCDEQAKEHARSQGVSIKVLADVFPAYDGKHGARYGES